MIKKHLVQTQKPCSLWQSQHCSKVQSFFWDTGKSFICELLLSKVYITFFNIQWQKINIPIQKWNLRDIVKKDKTKVKQNQTGLTPDPIAQCSILDDYKFLHDFISPTLKLETCIFLFLMFYSLCVASLDKCLRATASSLSWDLNGNKDFAFKAPSSDFNPGTTALLQVAWPYNSLKSKSHDP